MTQLSVLTLIWLCRLLSSTDTESLPENFCMIESQQSVRVSMQPSWICNASPAGRFAAAFQTQV